MSLVLGIDTATAYTCVAVAPTGATDRDAVAERSISPGADGRPRHGPELMAAIEQVVEQAGGWPDVARIAVGAGPGSFTGIRIGVATARGLAQARGLPLASVGSTAALAAGLRSGADRRRLGVIDARRGEIFAAVIEPGEEIASAPLVVSPADLAERLQPLRGALACGDGALRFRSELEVAGVMVPADEDPAHRLSARYVCLLGAAAKAGPPEDVTPIYLRRPDAERWRERDSRD